MYYFQQFADGEMPEYEDAIRVTEDKPVRERWKEYYKQLCVQNPDQMELKQRSEEKWGSNLTQTLKKCTTGLTN